jgi:hypothetical protein
VNIRKIAIRVTFVMPITNVKGEYAKTILIVLSITAVRILLGVVQMWKPNASLVKKDIVVSPAIALPAGSAI